jgi:hypothetical protein
MVRVKLSMDVLNRWQEHVYNAINPVRCSYVPPSYLIIRTTIVPHYSNHHRTSHTTIVPYYTHQHRTSHTSIVPDYTHQHRTSHMNIVPFSLHCKHQYVNHTHFQVRLNNFNRNESSTRMYTHSSITIKHDGGLW